MQIEGWDEPWVLFHETQSAKYRKLTIPSPPAHVLRQHGVLPTTMGPRPWKLTFGSEFADWADLLPVAILEPRALRCLDLDAPMETQLEERWLDGGFALLADAASRSEDGRLVRLLRIAADHGLKPVDGFELPPLTDRPAEAVELRDAGQTVWISPSELLTSWPSGWDFHGVERPPAEPVGEVEVVSMDEYFPALVGRIDDAVQVWECDGVLVDQRPVPVGRRGDAFLVTRGSDRPMVLRWIVDNLLPQVPAAEREDLVSQHLAAEYEALAERVRSQPDDAARLAVLLGQDGLRSACREAAPWAAERSALDQAELLLTLFGPSVLKELSNLIPAGLGVPGQWAGGQRTLEFVRYLGFGDEFAGRRKAERSDAERVLGPTEVGELHDFQVEIAERVQEIIATSGRGMVDLPTGAGKTRVTVESLLRHAHSVGGLGVVLWIAEREELCEQAVTAWLQLWRAKGLRDRELTVLRYWGGSRQTQKDVGRDTVIIASRQQLRRRIDNGAASWIAQANLVVIDEAHHTTASSYIDIIQWRQAERESSFAVLGLSATPFRSDFERTVHLVRLFDRSLVAGELMGDVWKDRIRWLQERRYLSSVKWTPLNRGEVAPTEREAELLLDQSNLTTGIDLINERLGDDHERNLQIIGSIQEMNPAWSVVVFAGSVRHAKTLAMMLNDVGIRARPVWGELTRWARRHAIEEFRSGRVRVLTNFNVLSEGFDAPKTRAVVIARLVQSDGLFLQMLGRGMRGPKNGGTKKCLLVTTGERLPRRFDRDGNLDIQRHEYLWNPR